MSLSDSEVTSQSGEYKFFRTISHDRLLYEMLGSTKTDDAKSWKVLIMDKTTMKVMSTTCKMADITDQGISLVEELFKRRQPMPSMDVIYFMQPSKENIVMFISDMSGREPLYRRAFIFFSRPTPRDLINHIKCDVSVVPRIAALREMNLEFYPVDRQAFVTDQENALEELFGDGGNQRIFDACLSTMAIRLGTVFASLKELPFVRYRAPKTSDGSAAAARESVPSKLAQALWDLLCKYKTEVPNFPKTETCELLILDRSIDQIAPVIHEWTYDAMCHDLLDMDGNKCTIEMPSKTGGDPEEKDIILDDTDPIWLELRHTHIADASERLYEKMNTFASKNKAAQLRQSAKEGNELSTRDLQKMVQALPQYTEQVEKLTLHVEIAGKINTFIRDLGLRDLGQLEQDLVFGDAAATDVINFLRTNQEATPENKLRLLMIYSLVYPEKFEGDKATKLMQLAKLSPEDMKIINNMKLLVGSKETSTKKASSGFSLKFDGKKTKNAARKDRSGEEEESWQLFRFYPMLEELLISLNKGQLAKTEYECMNSTSSAAGAAIPAAPAPVAQSDRKTPYAGRSRRTANWGRSRLSDDGSSSESAFKIESGATDFKKMGQRIFVFIIGGATRSELRVCHKLTAKLKREVVLGTTCFDDPPQFITKLKLLFGKDDAA